MKKFSFLLALMILGAFSGKAALTAEQIDSLTNAAEAGNVRAMYELGTAYNNADGVQFSAPEAAKWWTKAAEAGDAVSQFNLAQLYTNNSYDLMDAGDKVAIKWYKAAADQGIVRALFHYGDLIRGWDREQEGIQCIIQAADKGDTRAQQSLAEYYFDGSLASLPKNYAKAVHYAKLAAEAGNRYAMEILVNCYNDGLGVPQSVEEAFKWAKKQVDMGREGWCCFYAGWCYENGAGGVAKDLKKAVECYRQGAADVLGDDCREALDRLGYSY